ncbi:tRNA pseudouridine(38-40) synthase TruA [Euzebya tangerina]|uniref:tRNA pseudouridine(38-40) synthase TruA n=1 Tax=Euzebya tangerina TaxID=591198 RepID=UPI0013C3328D|nr:tRNA pseudouridine(38-40) synthase TruA [Euzebya tangerina]
MTTTRLRIDLAYDGSPFAGFARQPDQVTVQGEVESALTRVLGGASVDTTCAGRTDRGVHAEAQTVHVDVPVDWPRLGDLPGLATTLDRMVGRAITIWRIRRVPDSFDARFSATGRRYRYRICDDVAMRPLWRHDTWHVGPDRSAPSGWRLDTEAMEEAGQALVGEHNYASFCRRRLVRRADGTEVEGTMMRRIDRLTVRRSRPAGLVLVRLDGAAFCHQMVRSITGTLVEVGTARRRPAWVVEVLEAQDRQAAGPVAPPEGLSLIGVRY